MAISRVLKRDGSTMPFYANKIVEAISKAWFETFGEEIENEVAIQIADGIKQRNPKVVSVEDIQSQVIDALFDIDETLASNYSMYKDYQAKEKVEYKFLTKEFLSKYKHKPDPFTNKLGSFVFYRTYSRWIDSKQRREYWWETVARTVDHNLKLSKMKVTKEMAEDLFDAVYNLKVLPSGRSLWVKLSPLY